MYASYLITVLVCLVLIAASVHLSSGEGVKITVRQIMMGMAIAFIPLLNIILFSLALYAGVKSLDKK
jgi:hypothetical protein